MSGWILNKPEKRNYKRIDCDIPIGLNIEGQTIDANATNISCGGLFLPIEQKKVRERADIELLINLPDQNGPVRIVGEVTRYQDGSFIGRRPEGVAIRFNGLYDDNILAIDKFIKKNHN